MFSKLAFRNVRRSARDYLVYVLTMTFIVALIFAFNSIIFSRDLQKMYEMATMMAAMIGIATFFIVLIVAWLINYMVRFMLEKRSREFGIYLLIGMKKKEVSILYMKENLMLGVGSFVIGLGLGVLLQQVLIVILYTIVQVELKPHLEFNRYCLLMTVCCFAGCYLLALFRCRRRFRKMNIHDLMSESQKNEEMKEAHEKALQILEEHKDQLELIAQKLLELETLDERTIKSLFETGEMPAPVAEDEYPSETEAASFEETKKALAKRDAEQAEGKEVPDEDEEVEVADVTEAPSDLEGPTENE